MFSDEQIIHYKTFGYVIMRNVFTESEIETMQEEFETAVRRAGKFAPKERVDGNAHDHARRRHPVLRVAKRGRTHLRSGIWLFQTW